HGRGRRGELECVQGSAVAAADHDNVTADEAVPMRLELVRDVAAEGALHRRRQILSRRPRAHNEGLSVDACAIRFHPTLAEVGARCRMQNAETITEDRGGLLQGSPQRATILEPPGSDIA